MQRLIIKNFGPIKDLDLEIQDFMVFIGPQASGKSTIAKVVYFFRNLGHHLHNSTKVMEFELKRYIKGDFIDRMRYSISVNLEAIFNFWKPSEQQDDFFLSYEYRENQKLILTKDNVEFIGFDFYWNKVLEMRSKYSFNIDDNNRSRIDRWEDINEMMKGIHIVFEDMFVSTYSCVFVPAGRMNLTSEKENSGFLETQFKNLMTVLRQDSEYYSNYRKNAIQEIDDFEKKILKANYFFNEEEIEDSLEQEKTDVLLLENGQKVLLENASSGQQEAVWIIQLVKVLMEERRAYLSIIEEPEAHLYPEAQRDIVNLIALLANTNQNQLLITTHSPYILAAINNLLYAHQVGQKKPEKVAEKIDKNLWLDVKRLGVYFVDNGKVENIIDAETGIIDNLYLDNSVTKLLNEDLETLLNLEN